MKKPLSILIILSITILLCYLSIYYFVLAPNIPLKDAGPIGDMLAGLTMPFITLVSVVLLYFSFQEQLEANRIQNKALQEEIRRSTTIKELNQILDLLKDVKDEISGLEIALNRGSIYGHDTIHGIKDLLVRYGNKGYQTYTSELSKPMELLEFICSKTQSYKFELRDEQVIYEKLRLIYPEDFSDGIEELMKEEHPFPDNIKIELNRRRIHLFHFRICKYLLEFNRRLQEQYEISPDEKLKNLESKTKYLKRLSELYRNN